VTEDISTLGLKAFILRCTLAIMRCGISPKQRRIEIDEAQKELNYLEDRIILYKEAISGN